MPGGSLFAPFSRPFRDPGFYVDFMLNWAHFGLPFGSLWLPFGTLWLTLGALWLPFGSLLVPLGSLLVPMGSLLVPLSLDFLIFGASWRHSSYLFIFLKKMLCKIILFEKCYCKSDCCLTKSRYRKECRMHFYLLYPQSYFFRNCNWKSECWSVIAFVGGTLSRTAPRRQFQAP